MYAAAKKILPSLSLDGIYLPRGMSAPVDKQHVSALRRALTAAGYVVAETTIPRTGDQPWLIVLTERDQLIGRWLDGYSWVARSLRGRSRYPHGGTSRELAAYQRGQRASADGVSSETAEADVDYLLSGGRLLV